MSHSVVTQYVGNSACALPALQDHSAGPDRQQLIRTESPTTSMKEQAEEGVIKARRKQMHKNECNAVSALSHRCLSNHCPPSEESQGPFATHMMTGSLHCNITQGILCVVDTYM